MTFLRFAMLTMVLVCVAVVICCISLLFSHCFSVEVVIYVLSFLSYLDGGRRVIIRAYSIRSYEV